MAISQREKWIEVKQMFSKGVRTWQFWVGIASVFVFPGLYPICVYLLLLFKVRFGMDVSLLVLLLGLACMGITIRDLARLYRQNKQRQTADEPKVMNWLLGPALVGSLFIVMAGLIPLLLANVWIDLTASEQAKAALMFVRHAYGL